MKVTVRAYLPGSIQDVFTFVADPVNDPLWVDTTPKVWQVKGDGPGLDAEYAFEQGVQGTVAEGTITFERFEPPHHITFRVEDKFRVSRITYDLAIGRDGRVMLRQVSRPKWKPARLRRLAWLTWGPVRRQLRKQMRALEAYWVERASAAPAPPH